MTTSEPGRFLASDAEREHAVELLNAAFAHGRLGVEEFGDRVSLALAARTQADLADLVEDLPSPAPSRPRPPAHRPLGERVAAILNSCLCCGGAVRRDERAQKTVART